MIIDFKGQPVPFFYVHLLFFISALYLPMFAYTLAMDQSIGVPKRCETAQAQGSLSPHETCWFNLWWELMGLSMIFVQNLVVIGLFKAAQQASSPSNLP